MVPMPVPPSSGGDDSGGDDDAVSLGLRLSDAEGIAAERLERPAAGSLKEALAIASGNDVSLAELQPAIGVGIGGENFASGPLVRLVEARSADIGRSHARKPLDAFSPMPMPPALEIGIVLAKPVHSVLPPASIAEITAGDEPALAPSEDWQGFALDMPRAPVAAPAMEPLTSALDAAVRLAADASVAAEALENLKRLLEQKQLLESQFQPGAADPAPAPGSHHAELPAVAPDVPASPPLPPLPLPLHAQPDATGAGALLPPPPRRRPPPERRGLDVRGFMAGFALSWAFGVVLYLFMTAG